MNVILFDGVCNLCNGIVSFIIKRDKKALFRFAAIQSGAGQTLLRRQGIDDRNRTLYYFRNDVCFEQSTAVLHILKDLGGGWKCFYVLMIVPACIRDAAYRLVAKNRYRIFGKKQSCLLPSPDIKDRFLDDNYGI